MPGEFDFGDVNRDRSGEIFNRHELKRKLSGTFSPGELMGDAKTRPNTPEKRKDVSRNRSKKNVSSMSEKPLALINESKSKEQSKENKGFLKSIWAMFHGDDTKERKMTISSRNTVEEIKEQLEKLYDRIKEYEEKLEDKSKEISSKLIDLKKKIVSLDDKIRRSRRRINLYEKQIRGYETDLEKIKDTDDFMKQTIIDGKIKELNSKVQKEREKLESYKSELKPFAEKRGALEKKSKEIKKSIANLKKKSVAIDQKLGRHSVSKESTFEILRRSIKENVRRREIEPSQVSNENHAFRTTWNNKTYSFGNPEALKDLSMKGLTFKALNLEKPQKPRLNWLEQRLKRAEQNGFSVTPSDERENNKEHGGKDNPDR